MGVKENNERKSGRKWIKCFCNDDIICGSGSRGADAPIQLADSPADLDYLHKFLANRSTLEHRSCYTDTVCLTKKIKYGGDKEFLKYSCDYTPSNAIRSEVLEFRDCKVNTGVAEDRLRVVKTSAEHCCDDRFYCNIGLVPTRAIHEPAAEPAPSSPSQRAGAAQPALSLTNLALSCFSVAVFLLCLFLFIFYMYKKFRLESAKSKFVKTHQMYRGSLNTENTSSCAASPVHPPGPLKPLLTASPYTSTSSSSSSSSSAASTSQSTANTSIKSHLYASDKHADAFEPFIQISSPLSTPSSALCHTLSVQTAQTPPSELEWSGSGSGAGFPQCVQRTIARQIRLVYPCVGKGRFGEVYKGEWRGEFVAVKTFNSADEKSWENECGIYSTSGFRHENILGFIAADNIDRGLYTELWLITEYHENGSLFDYLSGNQISAQVAVKMALSIVNGLVHLHMPIESCNGKPALAHCDLKSKNILVKSDLSCCIGDLGLALSGDRDGKVVQQGSVRTGTKRYMAPEILAKRIDARYLENFQKAEMYSVALVLWELLRSCQFDDERTGALCSFEHKMPYFEYIQGDPDEALMSKIVCEQKIRPSVCAEWRHNKIMSGLLRLAEELWVENPDERLNALRLKKSLSKIRTNLVQRATLPTILA